MTEPVKYIEEKWDITYVHAVGKTVGEFLTKLRDEKQIFGKRCPKCQRILVPARSFCDKCYVETSDWVEVDKEGIIEVYTVVKRAFKGLPDPPYIIGYVRLNGADTAMLNYIRGINTDDPASALKLKVGAKARVVFKEVREGKITDFWFEIID